MQENIDTSAHREHLSNVNKKGERIWIYPRFINGKFFKLRTWVSWFFLVVFFAMPFIEIKGHPFMLFNVLDREFVLFGLAFWPQDFSILVFVMLAFLVFVILFTVIFGRVFCGWVCPQTVFMEMVFRKIERWIEGQGAKQKALDEGPWNREKILKKSLKFSLFFLISFAISNTFLAYLIGKKQWLALITDSPLDHIAGLFSLLIFTSAFYFVFAHFRELTCTLVCPYGRLQSVMLDPSSIVVAYDFVRGEKRGFLKKGQKGEDNGDCVDCKLCVQVCPTGIDIRNGTQMECINCTACIDACNTVMHKTGMAPGLIRFDSLKGIREGKPAGFNFRIFGYSLVLALLLGIVTFLMLTRADIETTVIRTPGMTYQETPDGQISNLYHVEMLNKTFENMEVNVRLNYPGAQIKLIHPLGMVKGGNIVKSEFFITMPKKLIKQNSFPMEIEIWNEYEMVEKVKTSFLGPVTQPGI